MSSYEKFMSSITGISTTQPQTEMQVVLIHEDFIVIRKDCGGDPRFFHLLGRLAALHVLKGGGYGTKGDWLANLRACEDMNVPPWLNVVTGRMSDKWTRIKGLVRRFVLNWTSGSSEPIEVVESAWNDFGDITNYGLLAYILYQEWNNDTSVWSPDKDDELAALVKDYRRDHSTESASPNEFNRELARAIGAADGRSPEQIKATEFKLT